ncbi:M48 family metallopeptidase [Chloroflexota bacterium]
MFQQIRSNQIRSIILVGALGVVLLVIGFVLGLAFLGGWIAGIVLALVIWIILNLVAFFGGDGILLAMSHAKKIEKQDHPRLYNIVEEMKIASGLEYMPDIYIIDDPALNAFATGRNPKKAAVAITSGLLQKLNRDELQGVIAHEIAHIKNRDVLLMTLCSILLGAIVLLSQMMFYSMLFGGASSRRRSSGGGGGHAIVMIIAIVLMILAPILAQLIYFAISRKREYLADASGALYTRYPEGLASALEKLGRSTGQLKSATKATAPMYIVNPFREKGMAANDLSSTHPPVSERIRILRSMGGGAGLSDYEQAYEQVHKGGGALLPAAALTGAPAVAASAPVSKESKAERLEMARETSDLLWKRNDYSMVNCECGTKLKVPPNYKGNKVKCPHCGRINPLPGR